MIKINTIILSLIITFFVMTPINIASSSNIEVQTVGWGPNDIEGFDGPGNPVPSPDQSEPGEGFEKDPETPSEYDPDNPYAEWES